MFRRMLALVGKRSPEHNHAWLTAGGLVVKHFRGSGGLKDITKGATHYLNVDLTRRIRLRAGTVHDLPKWARATCKKTDKFHACPLAESKVTVRIGTRLRQHTFLKLR